MAIQWYPGHMHKANKEMLEVMPNVDVIVEVLDARLPHSSANPNIAKLCASKPSLKVFSKADLADDALTEAWADYYQTHQHLAAEQLDNHPTIKTIALGQNKNNSVNAVVDMIRSLAPTKGTAGKTILAMITGIPNVGKSTLINALAGRPIAKTGNEPAVTKTQQRIKIDEHIVLLDTPGILWPKIYSENGGYRLATTGAIKDTAMSNDDVAYFAAEFLIKYYPERLTERYDIDLPRDPIALMEEVGKKRGALRGGGHVDFEKISKILLTEIRDGTLGRLTFETPEMIAEESIVVEQAIAEREAKKAAKKKTKRRRR